jgi:hypothetical protein
MFPHKKGKIHLPINTKVVENTAISYLSFLEPLANLSSVLIIAKSLSVNHREILFNIFRKQKF